MRESLKRFRKALDEHLMLPESSQLGEFFAAKRTISVATEEIVQAVANGEAAPSAELRELKETFWTRAQELGGKHIKLRILLWDCVVQALERVTFIELSRGVDAQCDCVVWRAVANGHSLSVEPSFPSSRVVENVDEGYECYRVHECGCCGARWVQDVAAQMYTILLRDNAAFSTCVFGRRSATARSICPAESCAFGNRA
jgi:hypothetical protein